MVTGDGTLGSQIYGTLRTAHRQIRQVPGVYVDFGHFGHRADAEFTRVVDAKSLEHGQPR